MKRHILVGGTALTLALSALSAAPITDLTNTGIDVTGPQENATGWQYVNDFGAGGPICPVGIATCTPGVAIPTQSAWVPLDEALVSPVGFGGAAPFNVWNTNTTHGVSHWIAPGVMADGRMDPGDGSTPQFGSPVEYTYQESFTLPDNFTSAIIEGHWWADGTLRSECPIMLNDTCIASSQPVPQSFAGPNGATGANGTFFSITQGFQAGSNSLMFFTLNGGWETGLRVTFTTKEYEFEDEPPNGTPEPSTYALLGGGLAAVALVRRRKKA